MGLPQLMRAGHLNAGIDQAVLDKTMTAAEGFAARSFARVIGSAIRAAANPGDPGAGVCECVPG